MTIRRASAARSMTVRLTALLLLAAGIAMSGPAVQAAPRAGLTLGRPAASGSPTSEGTDVTVEFRVANHASSRQRRSRAHLFLVRGGEQTLLGRTRVPALRTDTRRTLMVTKAAPQSALAGSYRVRVCLPARTGGDCRTTKRATVEVEPATLSPDAVTLDLGMQEVGTTSLARRLVVTNTGHALSGPVTTALTESEAVETFAVTDSTCGPSLAPSDACTIDLAFTPSEPGLAAATLTLSGEQAAPVTVALEGTGLAPALLSVTPESSTFPSTVIGGSSTPVDFTVANHGDIASGAPSVGLAGADAGAYSITGDTCASSLEPAETCTVSVRFAPTGDGTTSAQLTVAADPGGTATADLVGTGLAPAYLSMSGPSGDYGRTVVDSPSTTLDFVVRNQGEVRSSTPSASLDGTDADEFEITADSCTSGLAPGQTCTVSIRFAPTVLGDATASLTVSATRGGSNTADLTGTAISGEVTLTPASIDFGAVRVGYASEVQDVVLTNDTAAPVSLSSIVLGLPADFPSTWESSCVFAAIPAGASCTFGVQFAPTQQNTRDGYLVITGGWGTVTTTLTGVGTSPCGPPIHGSVRRC